MATDGIDKKWMESEIEALTERLGGDEKRLEAAWGRFEAARKQFEKADAEYKAALDEEEGTEILIRFFKNEIAFMEKK
jgi:hypothetical protein